MSIGRRPVDEIWPERVRALISVQCSIGLHPVDPNDPTWSELDRREYAISGCCPQCWDDALGPEGEN